MNTKQVGFAVAALISIGLIIYITVTKYNVKNLTSEFDNSAYYIPEYTDKGDDEIRMMGQFYKTGIETHCPVYQPTITTKGRLDISSWDSYYRKAYWILAGGEIKQSLGTEDTNILQSTYKFNKGNRKWLINRRWHPIIVAESGGTAGVEPINAMICLNPNTKISTSDIAYYPFFKDSTQEKTVDTDEFTTSGKDNGVCKIDVNATSPEKNVYQIVAPFAFKYVDYNNLYRSNNGSKDSDYRSTVRIQSIDGLQQLTFYNVINWFCAGEPDNDNKDVWRKHYKMHKSVIGAGKNASVKGGDAGCILGYWDRVNVSNDDDIKRVGETAPYVTIEIRDSINDENWKQISMVDWLFAKKSIGSNDEWLKRAKIDLGVKP